MIERIATEDEIIDNANVSFSTSAPTPAPAPEVKPESEAKPEPEVKPEPVKEEEKPVEKVIENPIASFVAKAQTTTPIETVEKPVEKKTRKKTETKKEEIVLTSSSTPTPSVTISTPSNIRHDFCKVELRCEPDSKITFQDALRIASSIDVLKNYGVNVNCVIEYVENGKLCDLSFTR